MTNEPRRVGRPARIDRDRIARAVVEIGFEDATMKRVAEHLGVSVPGLYYYVRGREDLLHLAAEYSLARTALPEDHGQHWATWLREWARYMRSSMAEPELMEHYISGEVSEERMIDVIGTALDVLLREGFEPAAALAAWEAIAGMALGSAIEDLRHRETTNAGRPWAARLHANLAQRPADEHQALRLVVDQESRPDRDAVFEERVTTLLVGIAVRHGREVDPAVLGRVDPVPDPPPRAPSK
jgi:AcrR family transcriptional regulator